MLNDPSSHGLWENTAPPSPAAAVLQEDLTTDVVVIGAGFTGLSTALHLREGGASVVVLEAVDVGFGGSGRNAGLVNAGLWMMPDLVTAALGEPYGERLVDLLGHAPRLVFELIATHAIECEAVQTGTLHCAVGRKGLAQLEQRAAQWQRRGAPVQLLSAAETAKRTGTDAYAGALFDARAGTIQPLAYVRGLARASLARGVGLFIRSPALSAERNHSGWTVRTPAGSVRAAWVVVATDAYAHGPWQVVRAEQARLPYFNLATAPLAARLRDAILPNREGVLDTRQVPSSFHLDAAGRLVFGSVGALGGSQTWMHESWARRALRRIFPQLGAVTFEARWFGYTGMTDDNLPRFHVFAPNVIGFSGFNGRGIAPGTAFGRVLAELIGGTRQQSDLPLPVTQPRTPALRSLKEMFYRVGSQAVHLAAARF